jgi:hypothetical protein
VGSEPTIPVFERATVHAIDGVAILIGAISLKNFGQSIKTLCGILYGPQFNKIPFFFPSTECRAYVTEIRDTVVISVRYIADVYKSTFGIIFENPVVNIILSLIRQIRLF